MQQTHCTAQSWPDEHQNGLFYYHADFQLQPVHPLLQTVTRLEREVPQLLGIGVPEERIHVFLFQHASTYRSYINKYFPSVPNRPALFVKQRGPGMVFARIGPELAVDLRHETTHAVLHSILPMVPLWLDEGLGEYFEMPAANRPWHPHLNSIRGHVRWGRAANIDRLEQLSDIAQMSSDHYRDAWAWVHFMLHGPPAAKQTLVAFLRDIEAHVPPEQLSVRLKKSVPNLNREFVKHFRKLAEANASGQKSRNKSSLIGQ